MFRRFQKNALQALEYYTKKYQKHTPKEWILEKDTLKEAYQKYIRMTSPKEWEMFRSAYQNIKKFHQKQKVKFTQAKINGNTLGHKI